MLVQFLSALALVFVIEGLIPFISPETWKRLLKRVCLQEDRAIRIMGFSSMFFGVLLLTIVHQFSE